MPDNVLRAGSEMLWVIGGTVVLLGIALSFAFKYDATSDRAGERGPRPPDQERDAEIAAPDGFIDSFSGVISEAGGGLPFMAAIIMITVLVSWVAYLIVNWQG